MIEYIAAGFAVTYAFLHIYFFTGLLKSKKLPQRKSFTPNVSVIVAARNEAENIPALISSLKELDYTPANIKIIIVNDKSTDNTKELLLNLTDDDNRFLILDSQPAETHNLKGKPNALDTAISNCKGDIILLTDADCRVHPQWVKNYVSYFDKNTGMVCGFTTISSSRKAFDMAQAIDVLYLLSMASGSCSNGEILSCIGNNMAFRRQAYIDIGGYEAIRFSITEDLALMKAVYKSKKYKVKFPINPLIMVNTLGCPTLKSLLNQKKRWFKGGLKISWLGYILGVNMYAINIILLSGFIFLPLYEYFTIILVKFISELSVLLYSMDKLKLKKLLAYYPLYQIYFAFYGLSLPFLFFFGKKVTWKGRKF